MPEPQLSFPLVPRGRLLGLAFGAMRSLRRGRGSDVAGSRPYALGDDVHAIDWAASARLSAARASDEFVVRERYAEEAPRVVLLCDRRPQMAHFAPPLPWLNKALALRRAAEIVMESAVRSGGFVGYLDYGEGDPFWRPPQAERRLWELRDERLATAVWRAPSDWLERAILHLVEHRRAVTAGSFVFVFSDFLPPPAQELWLVAVEHGFDVVPVVIQDPTWEQSFPDVSGLVVPLRDPRTGRAAPVLLGAGEAAARRRANEERLSGLLAGFGALGIEPVLLSSADPAEMLAAFLAWADLRRAVRAQGA